MANPSNFTDPPRPSDVPAAEPAPKPHRGRKPEPATAQRSRVSGVWIGLITAAIFLILLVVFIAQNSRRAPIHFIGWHGDFPIGLTILVAAVVGILVIAIPGSVRILQLRRALRKSR